MVTVANKKLLHGDNHRSTRTKPKKIVYIFMMMGMILGIFIMELLQALGGLPRGSSSTNELELGSDKYKYNLAKEQSFGFFDDINDENWKHYQTILAEVEDHQDPNDPHPYDDDTWKHYFEWYQTVSTV
jgi:hypothetical protein